MPCSGLHEMWEDGQAFKDLHVRLQALSAAKASIEAARKVTISTQGFCQHCLCLHMLKDHNTCTVTSSSTYQVQQLLLLH